MISRRWLFTCQRMGTCETLNHFSRDQSVLSATARRHRRGLLLVVVYDQGVSQARDATRTCSATRAHAAFVTSGTEESLRIIHQGVGEERRAITSFHPHSTLSLQRLCRPGQPAEYLARGRGRGGAPRPGRKCPGNAARPVERRP